MTAALPLAPAFASAMVLLLQRFSFATVAAAGICSSTAPAAFTFDFLHVQVVLYYTVLVGDVLYLSLSFFVWTCTV